MKMPFSDGHLDGSPMGFPGMTSNSSKFPCLCPHLVSGPKYAATFSFYPSLHEPSSIQSINQMPVEMLREIFTKFVEVDSCFSMCTENRSGASEYSRCLVQTQCPTRGPADTTILGQVCSYWRQVALSTPSVWSTIHVTPDTNHLSEQIKLTKMFLARAGTSPLDLALKDCKSRSAALTSSAPSICATRTFLSLFLSRIQYWRNIDFHLPLEVTDMLFAITNSPKPPKCHNLRSASVLISNAVCNELLADQSSNPVTFLANGSWANPFLAAIWKSLFIPATLKELTWWPGFERIFSDTSDIVSTQITCLNIPHAISVDELLRVLSYFPNTEEVVVSDLQLSSPSESGQNVQSPLLLASLRTLHLVVGVNVKPIFDALRCPALRTLNLNYFGSMKPSFDDALSLHDFLQGSECLNKVIICHNCNVGD